MNSDPNCGNTSLGRSNRSRNMSYYRGQLKRSIRRYRAGEIDAELLARGVEYFLQNTY